MTEQRFQLRAAVYLILEEGNKLLCIRRFNTGFMDGKYSLVAGHLDGNEPVTVAMAREAFEEAGLVIKPRHLSVVHTMHRKSVSVEYVDFFLTPTMYIGEPQNKEPDKCDEMTFLDITKLPENMVPSVKYALMQYKAGKSFSEFGWTGDDAELFT